jgi:RNA-directed DNA polymerase
VLILETFKSSRYAKHSASNLLKSLNQIISGSDYPIDDLYGYICETGLLRYAFDQCKVNKGIPGIDGVSFTLFNATNINYFIRDIEVLLNSENYTGYPNKIIDIKEGSKERSISIPTIRDRTVQKAISLVLSVVLDPIFLPCSFAYRNGVSANDAVGLLLNLVERKRKNFVYKFDIKNCFGSIDRQKLLSYLEEKISDKKLLTLIRNFIESEAVKDGEIIYFEAGIPQGNSLSPILSNLYLHNLDSFWYDNNYHKKYNAELVRYADDICVLSKYENTDITEAVQSCLEGLGLLLNLSKSRRLNLRLGQSLTFLGYEIQLTNVKPTVVKVEPRFSNLERMKGKLKRVFRNARKGVFTLEESRELMGSMISGFENYYIHSTSRESFDQLDEMAKVFVGSLKLK